MTSRGNSFNDFPEIVATTEITAEPEATFVVFWSAAVGLFLEWAPRCSIDSTQVNGSGAGWWLVVVKAVTRIYLRGVLGDDTA